MSKEVITVGTRKSQLALTQTNQVIALLKENSPQYDFHLRTISTAGDRVLDRPALFSHQGIFVKELEEALKKGTIDLAVHSLKDLPCDLPEGLELGALLERVDPRDALITRDGTGFSSLKAGATIGTSSIRRRAQVLFARKDLKVVEMRGNVDTRLRKLREGLVDALIIAAAGITRLGEEKLISERIPLDLMLPAPCQGALAIEVRKEDERAKAVARKLDHGVTRSCIVAERSFLKNLGGGCSLPVGALAQIEGQKLTLRGQVISPDGLREVRRSISGHPNEADALGAKLAADLLHTEGEWIRIALQSPFPGNP